MTEVQRTPYQGIGKPERTKHLDPNTWSRRITQEHRFVYRVDGVTLLTELQVPNETGELFPGAYALITLQASDNTGILTIPSNALLFRSEGTTVGVVDADGRVAIRKITTNLNLGDKLEISQGLSETDPLKPF